MILTIINNLFIMGPAFIGIPVFVREILKSEFTIYAYFETCMALGMLFGSLLFWLLNKKINTVLILLFGIIIDGITFSILFFCNSNNFGFLILFFHGIGIPLITISRTTIIQIIVPAYLRGRLFSIIYMSVMGTTALSIAITGIFLDFFSVDKLFLFIGLFASMTALIGFKKDFYKINI